MENCSECVKSGKFWLTLKNLTEICVRNLAPWGRRYIKLVDQVGDCDSSSAHNYGLTIGVPVTVVGILGIASWAAWYIKRRSNCRQGYQPITTDDGRAIDAAIAEARNRLIDGHQERQLTENQTFRPQQLPQGSGQSQNHLFKECKVESDGSQFVDYSKEDVNQEVEVKVKSETSGDSNGILEEKSNDFDANEIYDGDSDTTLDDDEAKETLASFAVSENEV